MLDTIASLKRILFIFFLCSFSFINGQNKKFNYDKEIILKYAILGMEEYNQATSNNFDFTKYYDVKNYLTHGKIVKDCKGNEKKVILVTFKNKTTKGAYHASVYIIYSDGLFDSFLSRGYSIVKPKDEIEEFEKHETGDNLFHCGL